MSLKPLSNCVLIRQDTEKLSDLIDVMNDWGWDNESAFDYITETFTFK